MKIDYLLEKNNLVIKQAVILAGGFGKRLGERSLNCPKPMQLINKKPFLDNIIWNLKRHDIKDIILSIGYLAKNFKDYYGNGSKLGVKITFVEEQQPEGTGGALRKCSNLLDEYFLLINGDTISDINYHDLALNFQRDKIGNLGLSFVKNTGRYGEVHTDGSEIISFKEKKGHNSGYINSGVAIFNKKILNYIPSGNCSLEKDIYQKLLKRRLLTAKKYNSFFLDIGTPETLEYAQSAIPKWKSKSALFLDRDGVINVDYGYVHSMKNFKFINGAKEMIKLANDYGMIVIVVTNQAGIARGFYSEEEFKSFTKQINQKLKNYGAHIDATYFCPHHPLYGKGDLRRDCKCRKPKSGMLESAIIEWNLNKRNCFLIGDKKSDLIAASKCGIAGYLFSEKKDNLLEIFKTKMSTFKS